MQPVVLVDGVPRFRANACVVFLLKRGGLTMNDLAAAGLPSEDAEQFAQLVGYSVSGFCDLGYVCTEAAERATAAAVKAIVSRRRRATPSR